MKYIVSDTGIKKKAKNPVHDANVIGDTVGDPFKDTSGPSLNILIKLMSVMALVLAPRFKQLDDDEGFKWNGTYGGGWWIAIILAIFLAIVIIITNLLITKQVAAFKASLEVKKAVLVQLSGGTASSDAPAMSPARKAKESKKLAVEAAVVGAEIEMVEAAKEEPVEEAAAAPAEEAAAAPVEEEAPAAEEEAAAAPAEEEAAAAPAEEEAAE